MIAPDSRSTKPPSLSSGVYIGISMVSPLEPEHPPEHHPRSWIYDSGHSDLITGIGIPGWLEGSTSVQTPRLKAGWLVRLVSCGGSSCRATMEEVVLASRKFWSSKLVTSLVAIPF